MNGKFAKLFGMVLLFALVSVIAVGCSGAATVESPSDEAPESSVQLPAVSAGDSGGDASDDVEEPEPLMEETEAVEEVMEEPEIAYPEPADDVAMEDDAYPEPAEESAVAADAYPEPEAEHQSMGESIEMKSDMSATSPGTVNLAAGQPQLVEFFAYWCPACQGLAPTIHALEVEFYPDIPFVYLDIDDSVNDEFKRELGYRVQPHIFLLDGEGNIIEQWVGSVSEEVLRSSLDAAVTN